MHTHYQEKMPTSDGNYVCQRKQGYHWEQNQWKFRETRNFQEHDYSLEKKKSQFKQKYNKYL